MFETEEQLKCRLYMNAVLPCLSELCALDAEARQEIEAVDFSLGFRTFSGLRTCLGFKSGICNNYGERDTSADIELRFTSIKQANRMFEDRLSVPPIPVRGGHRIKELKRFLRLTQVLQKHLRPEEGTLVDEQTRQIHLQLSFSVALGALCQLCVFEQYTHNAVKSGAKGVAQFSIDGVERPFWLKLDPENPAWGRGEGANAVDVYIHFKNTEIALKALNSEVDSEAAVGLGSIEVKGLVPLADQVDVVIKRVEHYLER